MLNRQKCEDLLPSCTGLEKTDRGAVTDTAIVMAFSLCFSFGLKPNNHFNDH